ncbi:MAG: hypothetical protein H6993_13650 [Pseudomonadales bacterium]|nr:hypothetical protein [Pseudomonadales bacterium]MCP5185005.1 hypothetical protein [Pseudomonadales bacterium]
MLKVFGFVRRHANLTHDDYRAAHVGYHNSYGRRLNKIRGYVLNVRANEPIESTLGPLVTMLSRDEPMDFDALWDGWGQLVFDTLDDYLAAKSPARDKPGPGGLEEDARVAAVGGDGAYLYTGSPFQFMVAEHVALPVRRPERKIFKLVQFAKRRTELPEALFRAYVTGRYAPMLARLPGLRGLIVNFRAELDVMTGFFPPDAEGFTPEGIAVRERFHAGWDCITELWFDHGAQFVRGRPAMSALDAVESELFASIFYREVDETVAVNPNRAPAPDFYFR